MDAKDLRTEAALGDRSNDGNTKYAQGSAALPCHRNKTYQDIGSNSSSKVDVSTSRPCAVIGPDRVVPPPVSTEAYLKKGVLEPWLNSDNTYRRPPDYPHKLIDYQHPTRNISPRQTFQENMQRIMVPPTYNTIKLKEDHNFQDANISQMRSNKLSVSADSNPKFCDVPYTINPMTNELKNVRNADISVPNINNVHMRSAPQGWPGSVGIRPTKPYPQELYQYSDYPSCAGPKPMLMTRPHRPVQEEPGPVYPEAYYHDANVRFKPYPTVKDRFPQARYDYIGNYSNPFHPPPYPPHKYDMQKSSHPYPAYPQVPLKYIDGRMPDPMMNSYPRQLNQQQAYNNIPFRAQVIHPSYGPMPGNCMQSNKFYPYPVDTSKSIPTNKLPYDANSKIYAEFENRNKTYHMSEGLYVNDISRPHAVKGPVLPSYPTNMHPMPGHAYYRKDSLPMRGYEFNPHFRNIDPALSVSNNHNMPRFPSQFSPNTIAISPSDSNTSNDTNQTQGTSQEDCGYVSQSSTASIRSMETNFNRMQPDVYRRYDHRYGPIPKSSPTMSKLNRNPNNTTSSKDKKEIDVRQFLQMWNEGEDDHGDNNNKEVLVKNVVTPNNDNNKHFETNDQEQLYVLGLVNVPSEELSKYEHIQKVSKLPENIKGYNSIELLHQFEEVIESSNLNNYHMKAPISRDFRSPLKGLVPMHGIAIPPRPLSPLDVEAKISQSVIHKEVGCNFEIKPCSPKMLNVEVATSVQTVLDERTIEKVSNPLIMQSSSMQAIAENTDDSNVIKCQDRIVNENSKTASCKMINTQYSNDLMDPVKTNYCYQDLESNSGVCLASLPRLDNDIELNFPEVNQQFINANKESVITTASVTDLPPLDIEHSEKIEHDLLEKKMKNSPKSKAENDFSKLSKYRKLKRKSSRSSTPESNVQALRTDSVIIKNPENCKSLDSSAEKIFSPISKSENMQETPINLSVNIDHQILNIPSPNTEKCIENTSNDFAIDFSLSSTEQCDFNTSISDHIHSQPIINETKSTESQGYTREPTFDEDVCDFLQVPNETSKLEDKELELKNEDQFIPKTEIPITDKDKNDQIEINNPITTTSNSIEHGSPLNNTNNILELNKTNQCKSADSGEFSGNTLSSLKTIEDFKADNVLDEFSAPTIANAFDGENLIEKEVDIISNPSENINNDSETSTDKCIKIDQPNDTVESETTMKLQELENVSLEKKMSLLTGHEVDGKEELCVEESSDSLHRHNELNIENTVLEKKYIETRIELGNEGIKNSCPINKELLSPYIQKLLLHNEGLCDRSTSTTDDFSGSNICISKIKTEKDAYWETSNENDENLSDPSTEEMQAESSQIQISQNIVTEASLGVENDINENKTFSNDNVSVAPKNENLTTESTTTLMEDDVNYSYNDTKENIETIRLDETKADCSTCVYTNSNIPVVCGKSPDKTSEDNLEECLNALPNKSSTVQSTVSSVDSLLDVTSDRNVFDCLYNPDKSHVNKVEVNCDSVTIDKETLSETKSLPDSSKGEKIEINHECTLKEININESTMDTTIKNDSSTIPNKTINSEIITDNDKKDDFGTTQNILTESEETHIWEANKNQDVLEVDEHVDHDRISENTGSNINSQHSSPTYSEAEIETFNVHHHVSETDESTYNITHENLNTDRDSGVGNTVLEASNNEVNCENQLTEISEDIVVTEVLDQPCNEIGYISNYTFKKRKTLKRSFSDSALDDIRDGAKEITDSEPVLWSNKRQKNTESLDDNEPHIFAENCKFIQSTRRNSISSMQNEENVSFCILIDNNCIITDECDDTQKICFAELSEECLHDNLGVAVANINSEEETNVEMCESTDDFMRDDKPAEDPWFDDVACVETVIADDIAENIIISAATSPKNTDLSDEECTDKEPEEYNVNEHSDKLKYIYGDKMCSDDSHFVETLYRTPQMNVNKTLVNRESHGSQECTRYYDKESLERVLSESYLSDTPECDLNDDNMEPRYASSPINDKEPQTMKDNLLDSQSEIKTDFDCKDIYCNITSDNEKCDKDEVFKMNLIDKDQRNDSITSCESSSEDIFAYKKSEGSPKCSVSSSPEVSSTTSEEKNSGILLKITNYGGARVSQVNDVNTANRICCKYTEQKDYLSSNNNLKTRTILTKAAQKYIPPLKETIPDLKVKLPLSRDSLLKFKELKVAKEKLKPNLSKTTVNTLKKDVSKKPKPKFEDVLLSIDEIQFQMHKEKSKKIKKSIPKVVIKKNEYGSHYASTSRKDIFNPDLTGRKWQPWVFLEKNNFIDKMALRRKTRAIFNHRKNTYVLAEKFRKYKSVGSTKFFISQPKVNDSISGQLKYTIRLKHNY